FEAMLEKAARLCEFPLGILWTHNGRIFRPVAWCGAPSAYAGFLSQATGFGPFPDESALGRMAAGEDVAQIDDVAAEDAYGPGNVEGRALVELAGARTVLCVALRKDDALLGVITGYRQEVRHFSGKQIALLQNFAAQAVIAIENARLISETREALEQQTATAEVLEVINSSPGDLAPVFDAMLQKAMQLCGAAYGHLNVYDGERFCPMVALGVPKMVEWLKQRGPVRPGSGTTMERIAKGEGVIHI